MTHSALWHLEHLGLLDGISDEQKRQVERNTRVRHLRRGQPVYLEGDPSDALYLVRTGAVKILGTSPDGCEVILSLMTAGDIFGELALASDQPQDHRAEATDETVLCEIGRDVLSRMVQEAPRFSLHLTKIIGLRLRTLGTRLEELLGKSAPARLAHALLELARKCGIRDSGGVLIPLRISQAELGQLVGLTRETINGILQSWREQGVVEMDRRQIRLRDPDRLMRVR